MGLFSTTPTSLSDSVPMADSSITGVTSHAALTADLTVAALDNKSQNSSGVVTGSWVYLGKASTNSSGVATVYLTSDGTSGGTAAFSTVYEDGIIAMAVGADNYQVTSCVLAGDKKSLAVTLNYIRPVLGVLTLSSTAPAGVEVRTSIWGK